MLDVLREDYLRTARAKGLRPMAALRRHGLRNAAIPVVTVLGLQLATLLSARSWSSGSSSSPGSAACCSTPCRTATC